MKRGVEDEKVFVVMALDSAGALTYNLYGCTQVI